VAHLIGTLLVSERMACGLVGLSRSAYRCPLQADTRAVPDRALHDTGSVRTRRSTRRGYRCAYHSARGEGWAVNHKKIQRLWQEEGLRVSGPRRRKRVGSSTIDAPTATEANTVWAVDFQFNANERACQMVCVRGGFPYGRKHTVGYRQGVA